MWKLNTTRSLLIVGCLALFGPCPAEPCAYAQADPIEVAKLLPSDGAELDRFGVSVSISGDTAVIGAKNDDDNGDGSGSAYVFESIGGTWTQVAKLLASDGAAGDKFGVSVSIIGDIAIVGAFRDDDNGGDSGSAYVFECIGGVWTQVAKLLASDGAAGDMFGQAVSISGGVALIGAMNDDDNGIDSGSAYVFEKVGGVWTQTTKLVAADGAAHNGFGRAVSISGGVAIVAAPLDDDLGYLSGSAYIFEKIGGVWTQTAKLLASDGAETDWFGTSVSLSGDTAIVSSMWDDDLGQSSGSAYIFEKIGGTWAETAKLLASDGGPNLYFGESVSICGDVAVIGAEGDGSYGYMSGAAYVFQRIGGQWTETAKLLASDGAEGDSFGEFVSVSGDTVIAGAKGDDDNGENSGSAYVFDLNLPIVPCPADVTGNGIVDVLDLLYVLAQWGMSGVPSDINGDGIVNVLDILEVLAAWGPCA